MKVVQLQPMINFALDHLKKTQKITLNTFNCGVWARQA